MGREIKFRAWDKENHEMVDLSTHGKLQYNGIDGPKLVFGTDWHDDLYDSETEDFELMQCTGLKDKHGRDIYEGDIVRFKHENGYSAGQVVYGKHNGAFCFYLPDEKLRIPMLNFMSTLSLAATYDFEVIGNIYQNPELLSKEGQPE